MKTLLVSAYDWANVGKSFEIALKAVGEEAKAISFNEHELLPKDRGELVKSQQVLNEYLAWADAIILMHSEPMDLRTNKPIFVFHGGSRYRTDHAKLNEVFNPRVTASIIQTYDLFGLGAKNEKWVIPPIDTDAIKPVFKSDEEYVKFAHYPRCSMVKGSASINYAFYKCGGDFTFSDERVSREDNLKRMAGCDVYMEAHKCVSDWGVTTLEAAALGKIVITQFNGHGSYENEFGACPILSANDLKQLDRRINEVLEMDAAEIMALQHQHRQWVKTNHSYIAVGERLKGILCE